MRVSQWLVLVYPVFLYFAHRRRATDDITNIDASVVAQLAFVGILGVWVLARWLASPRFVTAIPFKGPLRWMFIYAAIAAASALWSPLPPYTLALGLQLGVFLLVVADAVATCRSAQEMLRLQLAFSLLATLFWLYLPALSSPGLTGLHSSEVPATIVGSAFLGRMVTGKRWRYAHLFLLFTLLISTSSGAYIALLLGGGAAFAFSRAKGRVFGSFALVVIALAIMVSGLDVSSLIFSGKSAGNIASGTGRIPVWGWLIRERISQHPVLGFGFGVGEIQARLTGVNGFKMMHLHNSLMSATANLGLLGLAIFLIFLVGTLHQAFRTRALGWGSLAVGATVAIIANSLSASTMTSPVTVGSITTVGNLLTLCTILTIFQRWQRLPAPASAARA